ncbi:preprotein translocase subunit YajC [Mucilaginibacter gracilis]|uniref:Sec translocon accessory complex subunit YajC n=1 Tax=Mucilaginibacter gracilis TaxID=423350 RepID=A0A495J6Z8_9SPHI|nr:preprotein translocase subunit YajC [Mucilaginibacter gracilis]RKR84765.1 preprotein translocase subunit YajC [Mucilaginibacter gracilis]
MISTILLQLPGGSMTQTYIMFGLIFVVFYFFMIRPQIKKQKDQKKFVEELQKGHKVVTTAGIHGKVVEINDITVLVEVDNGVKIKFDKSAISLEASKALNAPAVVK